MDTTLPRAPLGRIEEGHNAACATGSPTTAGTASMDVFVPGFRHASFDLGATLEQYRDASRTDAPAAAAAPAPTASTRAQRAGTMPSVMGSIQAAAVAVADVAPRAPTLRPVPRSPSISLSKALGGCICLSVRALGAGLLPMPACHTCRRQFSFTAASHEHCRCCNRIFCLSCVLEHHPLLAPGGPSTASEASDAALVGKVCGSCAFTRMSLIGALPDVDSGARVGCPVGGRSPLSVSPATRHGSGGRHRAAADYSFVSPPTTASSGGGSSSSSGGGGARRAAVAVTAAAPAPGAGGKGGSYALRYRGSGAAASALLPAAAYPHHRAAAADWSAMVAGDATAVDDNDDDWGDSDGSVPMFTV